MYSNELICNVLNYIDNNIFNKIFIDDIANKYFINKYYLMKLFKKEIGISILNYINVIRINNSLKDFNNNSILNIALSNGFYSQEYFSEIFKKIIGVSPIKYKKLYYNPNSLSKIDYETILNSLIKIQEIIKAKEDYLNNKKPKDNLTKFYSLFNR